MLRQAVMALPSQDYELCRKMIPEKIQAEEPFVSLNALVACMTHAKFKEFWTQYATMKDSLDAGTSPLPPTALRDASEGLSGWGTAGGATPS